MRLKLKYYPDPVLREPTIKIKKFDRTLKKLADDMLETMRYEDGVGLAAPQVGKSIKLIVCWDLKKYYVFCNPEIVKQEGTQVVQEGCLSFPEQLIEVKRPQKLTVKYHDLSGKIQTLKAEGLLAQIVSHETEHLSGVLLCDSQDKKFGGI